MTEIESKTRNQKKMIILIDDELIIVDALKKMFEEMQKSVDSNVNKLCTNTKETKQVEISQKVVTFADFDVCRVAFDAGYYTFFIPDDQGNFNETKNYKEFVEYIRRVVSQYIPQNVLICVDVLLNEKSTDFRMGGNLLYSLKNEDFLQNSKFAFMTRNYFVDDVVKKLERLSGNKIISRPNTNINGYRKNDFEILPNKDCPSPIKELRELHTTYWNFISNVLEASLKTEGTKDEY